MSTMIIGRLLSHELPASAGRDRPPQSALSLAAEAAGRLVMQRPRTVSLVVIALALGLGSLAGASLSGIGRHQPPPLVRLTTIKTHIGAIEGRILPASDATCRSWQQQLACSEKTLPHPGQNLGADAP